MFTFSHSSSTRTGSELVPSEVMYALVGSMVSPGAAVEGRSEAKPVAERIQPQPVGKKLASSTESEAICYFTSPQQSGVLAKADVDIREVRL